jgi:uncharacterized membrane protein
MPYRWTASPPAEPATLTLWPHRSLPRRGFVWFIAATAILLSVPLLAQLGTAGLWVLLPFLLAALGAIWLALEKSYRDGQIVEELTLSRDRIALTHRKGRAAPMTWDGNPYWVRPILHVKNGPVPNYLTLQGSGREVELGAFLSEDERVALKSELDRALAILR